VATQLKQAISARWLCGQMGLELIGPDRDISEICPLDSLEEGGLSFLLPGRTVDALRCGTVVASEAFRLKGASVIGSPDPRLDFIRAQYLLEKFPGYERASAPPKVHPSARVAPSAVIENGVEIGEDTVVGPNAVVRSGARIGRHCEIKSGAVICDSGFGFERDQRNRPIRMVHLGANRRFVSACVRCRSGCVMSERVIATCAPFVTVPIAAGVSKRSVSAVPMRSP
jgi:UDP-3-O-[3-hydroxymyristoyl] glucosamine N-acyltransferase